MRPENPSKSQEKRLNDATNAPISKPMADEASITNDDPSKKKLNPARKPTPSTVVKTHTAKVSSSETSLTHPVKKTKVSKKVSTS